MCARRPRSTAASPASSARSPGSISRNGATSPTRWRMIAAKNHKNGVGNPYAQMRKDLGYDFCRTESEKNPVRRRPAQAHRLLAGVGRRRRGRARRRRHRAQARQGGRVPRRRARAGFPADGQARHFEIRRLRAAWQRALAQGGPRARRSVVRRDARLLHHRRVDRIRGHGSDRRRRRAPAPSRKAGRRRTASCRSIHPAA